MTPRRPYVGRFAPSPTGRLHLGSMVAAVASWLDAKAHQGKWLIRMEDLDPPREVEGAADDILRTLEGFGLEWDGHVVYQSQRHALYQATLESLKSQGLAFGCACTRKTLAQVNGLEVYPGTCRDGLQEGQHPRSWRFRMPDGERLAWQDRWQGEVARSRQEVGDVVLRRADGPWAYHLAVVVDDADQGITDVVRGADLVDATAVHLALQKELNAVSMRYMHVPLVTNDLGQKLSKQTLAQPVEPEHAADVLHDVFVALDLGDLAKDEPSAMLSEALTLWMQRFST